MSLTLIAWMKETTAIINLSCIKIRDAMLTKSARLNHKFQLPLGYVLTSDQNIVDIIESSKFESFTGVLILITYQSVWKICDGCMQYDKRQRFTFEQISEKMKKLNIKSQTMVSSANSAPNISKISNKNQVRKSDLTVGKLLGKYSVEEVFECFLSSNTEIKMAIKFFELTDNNRDMLDEFDKEASIMESLSHEYVIQFYGLVRFLSQSLSHHLLPGLLYYKFIGRDL